MEVPSAILLTLSSKVWSMLREPRLHCRPPALAAPCLQSIQRQPQKSSICLTPTSTTLYQLSLPSRATQW